MSISSKTALKLAQDARDPKVREVLSGASGGRIGPFPSQIEASHEESAAESALGSLKIVLTGAVSSGKNSIGVTRTGRRYPKARFVKWRAFAMAQLSSQIPKGFKTICEPVEIELDYFHGDNRRIDMPSIIDGIFHIFEKCAIVDDDRRLWVTRSSRTLDRDNPRTEITLFLP